MRGKFFYSDVDAAKLLHGNASKPDLTKSPFVEELEYGASKEGYWTYEKMVLQLEDIMDVLHYFFEDKYQFVFLFDHSNGHDRLQPNGLSCTKIRKNWGGKQPIMRDTALTRHEIGPFNEKCMNLAPGHMQSMYFSDKSNGPIEFKNEGERNARKFDKKTGNKKKKSILNLN